MPTERVINNASVADRISFLTDLPGQDRPYVDTSDVDLVWNLADVQWKRAIIRGGIGMVSNPFTHTIRFQIPGNVQACRVAYAKALFSNESAGLQQIYVEFKLATYSGNAYWITRNDTIDVGLEAPFVLDLLNLPYFVSGSIPPMLPSNRITPDFFLSRTTVVQDTVFVSGGTFFTQLDAAGTPPESTWDFYLQCGGHAGDMGVFWDLALDYY